MREYSLLSSKDDLDISTISINNIASEFGLLAPHGEMVIAKITIMMSESSGVLTLMRYKKQDQITMIDTKVK